jgi:hypothetical protein
MIIKVHLISHSVTCGMVCFERSIMYYVIHLLFMRLQASRALSGCS